MASLFRTWRDDPVTLRACGTHEPRAEIGRLVQEPREGKTEKFQSRNKSEDGPEESVTARLPGRGCSPFRPRASAGFHLAGSAFPQATSSFCDGGWRRALV